ncbi:NAD(P)/FAD-dependent oxidoreductase [Oceanobacillus halotolerans]|uniref:NAD(P)/FAD-dependent oxidoreductase n=1 Tax=Oceanobacillus halotolerans TaxID=2663380 RepID=UPI0013DBBBDD|nr:FAD-dependent oxidoreductase [Oceanobacillus halotolerans]
MQKTIVIGAGIVGATAAYQLAKKGVDVVVVDRGKSGQATDAAAGIICPWLSQRRNKAWYYLAKNGARIYPSLIEELTKDGEEDTGYAKVGAISLHHDEKKLTGMRDRALKRREDAPEIGEVTILSKEQAREKFPLLKEGYGAVHVSGAARVDGKKLRHSLLRAAEKHGATFIKGDAILLYEGNTIKGVSVDGEDIKADRVIATSGAWMKDLFAPLGIDFKVTPQRGQIIHLQLNDQSTNNWPLIMPPTSQSIVPTDDNRVIIGSTHEDGVGFDDRITAGGLYDILNKAISIAPALENATVLETRVGFRPYTPGFLPVVGPLPGFKKLYLANGLGASGLTTGPYIGIELAKLALGEEIDIPLDQYDISGAIE